MPDLAPAADALKCDLAAEVLRPSGQLRLRVSGASMLPALWPGYILTIHRQDPAQLRPGDLVLAARNGGGEVLLREDFFEILGHARALLFNVRLKTNGTLLRERDAERLHDLGVEQVQVSIYSHRPEVHDGITRITGSLERSVQGIRLLKSQGLKVAVSDVLMRQNMHDYAGVQALAADLGAVFTMDPTVTPKMNGDRSVTDLRGPSPLDCEKSYARTGIPTPF
jgi:MoaA/NifB/PqqE/SkfB family radical SAM enzyme